MIIYDILKENKDKLKFLGKSNKNIDIISNMITELKKHNITSDILENINIEETYTRLKLEDVKLIYKKYNEKIEKSFIDENDSLTLVIDKISKSTIFDNSLVYIDDFIGFTPQEYMVFEQIIKKADSVSIAISMDDLEKGEKEQDVFYFNKLFSDKLIKICNSNQIKV